MFHWRDAWLLWAFALLSSLAFAVFFGGSLIFNLLLSLSDWSPIRGMLNLLQVEHFSEIFRQRHLGKYATVTGLLIAFIVPMKVLVGMGVGLLLYFQRWGRSASIVILLIPSMLSFASVSVIWGWFFNPIIGPMTELVKAVYGWQTSVFNDPVGAFLIVSLLGIWKSTGFNGVIFYIWFRRVPERCIDAMQIDGANRYQIVRDLILPLSRGAFLFVTITSILYSVYQVFIPVDILTKGGPQGWTNNLFYWTFLVATEFFNYEFAAAGNVLLLGAVALISAAVFALFERRQK